MEFDSEQLVYNMQCVWAYNISNYAVAMATMVNLPFHDDYGYLIRLCVVEKIDTVYAIA